MPLIVHQKDLDKVTSEKLSSGFGFERGDFLGEQVHKCRGQEGENWYESSNQIKQSCFIYISSFIQYLISKTLTIQFFSPELITVYTRSMLNLPIFPTILPMKTKLYYKKCYLPPTNSSLGELLKIQMTSQPLKIWTHLGLKWGPDISIFQRVPR